MEQESVKEIILFIDNAEDYETFSDIFSSYGTVIKYNPDNFTYDESRLIGVCLIDDKLNKSNLIKFREQYQNVKIIGVFDHDEFINASEHLFINSFINHQLLENTKEMKKIIKMLTVDLVDTSLNIVLNKKSKAFNLTITSVDNLNWVLDKICNLVQSIKKLSKSTLLDIFTNIYKINKDEEMNFNYGIDKEKISFHINIKNAIGLNTIEDLYSKVMCTENTKALSLPLKTALSKSFSYFSNVILNIERSGINFTFSYYLTNDDSKNINLIGRNFNHKISKIKANSKNISASQKLDKYVNQEDVFNDEEKNNIEKIISAKKQIELLPIDFNNLTIDEVLELLKKNNLTLEAKFKQIIEDYRLVLEEKFKAEKISETLGEEVKDLMRHRKEPTTDAELKDVKRKLEEQIYKLYRDLGVQKAKGSKLVKHINLLKEKIVQSRIGQEKLRTELKEKNKKIHLLEEQLKKMEKSLLDF